MNEIAFRFDFQFRHQRRGSLLCMCNSLVGYHECIEHPIASATAIRQLKCGTRSAYYAVSVVLISTLRRHQHQVAVQTITLYQQENYYTNTVYGIRYKCIYEYEFIYMRVCVCVCVCMYVCISMHVMYIYSSQKCPCILPKSKSYNYMTIW